MFDVITDGPNIKDGDWTIGTWQNKPALYTLNREDVSATIFDYWARYKDQAEFNINSNKDNPNIENIRKTELAHYQVYKIHVEKELKGIGTIITRTTTINRNLITLDRAKEFLLKEIDKLPTE